MVLMLAKIAHKADFTSAKSPLPLFAKEGDYLGGLLITSGRICRKIC